MIDLHMWHSYVAQNVMGVSAVGVAANNYRVYECHNQIQSANNNCCNSKLNFAMFFFVFCYNN